MAGFYPDAPGQRMAYDRDGSVGFHTDRVSSVTVLTGGQLTDLNDEGADSVMSVANGRSVGVIFPELRDAVGAIYNHGSASATTTYEKSSDTTNGMDGTWTTITTTGAYTFYSGTQFRTNITTFTANGVNAIRATKGVGGDNTLFTLHLYGKPSSGEAPDRLRFWHPTLDQEVTGAYFDWGDIEQGSTATRDFRVKNPSATLTAEDVEVSAEALTDTTPTNVSQHDFDDGGGFASTAALGDLGPGDISSVVTLRRQTDPAASLSVWWLRLVATASAWV